MLYIFNRRFLLKKYFYYIIIILLFTGCSNKYKTDFEIHPLKNSNKQFNTNNRTNNTTKPLTDIEQDDELLIMVRSDGAPGMFLNEQNELEGFYVDLEKVIMKEMNQNYRFVTYSDVGKAIQQLKIGEFHSALATPDVPDLRLLANISTPFEKLDFAIFLPENTKEMVPESRYDAIRFLYGKRVGVQTRGHIYQLLRDHPEIKLLEYPTTTIAMETLHKGEVDAVPEVNRIGTYYSKKNNWSSQAFGPSIFELNVATGFSKTLSQDIVYRYNTTLQKLIDSGLLEKMYNDYYGKNQ